MPSIGDITAKLVFNTGDFHHNAHEAASELKSLGGAFLGVGGFAAAAGAAVVAFAGAAIAAASDINSGFRVLIVSTGATGDALDALKEDFKAVFAEVPASAKEVADTISQISIRTGLAGEALRELAKNEIELAHITGAELGPQVEATTKLFNQWGDSIGDQSEALNFLFKVSQQTGISVTQLSGDLASTGPVMRQLGIDFEHGAAMIGAFDKAGLDSQTITAGMSIAFRKLVQSGQDPIKVFQDLIDKIKNTSNVMDANKLAVEAFGRGAAKMGEAIKSGRLDVEALIKSLQASHSTIEGTANDTRTLTESFEIMKNKIELALAPIGNELKASIKDAFNAIVAFVEENKTQITDGLNTIADLFRGLGVVTHNILAAIGDIMHEDWGKAMSDLVTITDKATGQQQTVFVAYGNWLTQTYWPWLAKQARTIASDIWDVIAGFGQATFSSTEAGADAGRARMLHGQPSAAPVFQSPIFVATPEAASNYVEQVKRVVDAGSGRVGSLAKKAGGEMAKSLISGFAEGIAGLQAAFAKIESGDLSSVFEKLGKKARAGAEEMKAALKVAAAAINEFVQTQGLSSKVTESQLALMDVGTRKSLENMTLAYQLAHGEIQRIEVEGLTSRKQVIDITIDAYTKMSTVVKDKVLALGATFHVVFPGMNANVNQFSAVINKASDDVIESMTENATITQKWSETATQAFEKVVESAPHWAGAIVDAAARVKQAMSDSAELIRVRAAIEVHQSFETIIQDFVTLGQQSKLTGTALVDFVQNGVNKLGPALREGAQKALQDFKNEMNKLPGALDEVWNKLALGAKSKVAGLFQVIDSIPGKFGDALRKSTNTITTWINQIDGLLKGLHKIFQSVPDGLADVLQQVVGLFKGSSQQTQVSYQEMIDFINKGTAPAASGAKAGNSFAAGFLGKLTLIGSGISTYFATRNPNGAVTASSIAGAALAGAQIGAAFAGPWGAAIGAAFGAAIAGFKSPSAGVRFGTGFLAGGIVGGLISAIFGGPSDKEKAAMKAAADAEALRIKQDLQLRADQILQSAQATIQSAIDTFTKAADFFFTLDEFTPLLKEKFTAFFDNLTVLIDYFLTLAGKFSAETIAQLKLAAESFAPIADTISKLPEALAGIRAHVDIPKRQFGVFFSDVERLFNHFFGLMDTWVDGQAKRAEKLATRLGPVVGILSPLIEAIRSMADIEEPSKAAFQSVFRSLDRFVTRIGQMQEFFDKALLKSIENFAQKVSPVTDLWKGVTDGIKGMVDITLPSDASFEAIFIGIEKIVTGMLALADRLNTDALEKAESIASSSLAMFESIKAGVEAFVALQDFKGVLPEVFGAFFDDFNAAVDMLISMNTRAAQFQVIAHMFEDYIAGGAASLNHAFQMLSQIMTSAGGFFPGGSPVIVPGEGGATSVPRPFAASSFAGPSGTAGNMTVVNVTVQGSLVQQSNLQNALAKVVAEIQKRGSMSVFTGNGGLVEVR